MESITHTIQLTAAQIFALVQRLSDDMKGELIHLLYQELSDKGKLSENLPVINIYEQADDRLLPDESDEEFYQMLKNLD